MQLFTRKVKTYTLIASVLLIVSVVFMALPVRAQEPMDIPHGGATTGAPNGSVPLPPGVTPDVTVDVVPYLSFRPNPIGVGQSLLVNVFLTPANDFRRYFTGYKVTIERPGGTQEVIGPMNSYPADTTAWFEYVPDEPGTWKLKFDFPGGYYPPGVYTQPAGVSNAGYSTNFTRSCYYKPASTDWQTLTVQTDMVASWPPAPLPTDYWTRPVSPEKREWWSILGNYPWHGPGGGSAWPADTNTYWSNRYAFTPYVQAPNSAHIVWKKLNTIAGLIGGDYGIKSSSSGGGSPNIIFQGRCYQTLTKAMPTLLNGTVRTLPTSVWECYDLRTGNVIWDLTDVTAPSYIEYSVGGAEVVGGGEAAGVTASLLAISGNRLLKYNPATGAANLNISIPTFATNTYYRNGYCLSVQTIKASTGTGPGPNGDFRVINWTTIGSSNNFTSRILSNMTWPWDPTYSGAWTYDFSTGIAFQVMEINWLPGFPYVYIPYDNATGFRYGTNAQAYSLTSGTFMWNTTDITASMYIMIDCVADHGKLAVLEMGAVDGSKKYNFLVLNQNNGAVAYKSGLMDYPWGYSAFGAYSIQSAYGLFFREAMDGIYAFNWDDGSRAWKYEAPANPFETSYTDENGRTVYGFYAGAVIADGKLYTYATEHTPSQPLTRGWELHCVNATTGEGIWKIDGPMSPGAIADGYLVASNSYDGTTYCFGKGRSATSVSAPDVAVANGTQVVLKGTVMDLSPAQPGTPCVSKDTMKTQMEYLHMQRPIDGLYHNETITGVPVTLTAIESDGTVIDIGTATTNGYYGTFTQAWTPIDLGIYTIMASFAGDDSYGSSSAATGVVVGPSPTSATTSGVEQPPADNTSLLYAIAVAAIAIILAVAVATVLILRKR